MSQFCDDDSVEIGAVFHPGADKEGRFGLAMKSRLGTNVLWLNKKQWDELKKTIDQVLDREIEKAGNEYFCDPSYGHSSYADFRHLDDHPKGDLKK